MLPRSIVMPTLLAASVAVPYAATNAPQWTEKWGQFAQEKTIGASELPAVPGEAPEATRLRSLTSSPQGPGALLYPTDTPLEGLPTYSIDEVLRMDVSKEWVYQRWARKSTTTSHLDLFGVRVPIVSGTQLTDVAGSLTYYFGVNGNVHRLSLRGTTGDTTQLVTLVAQRYGLQRQLTSVAGEQLFQLKRGDAVVSELRTRPAPVLWSSTPHQSFQVELELQRPDVAKPLVQPPPQLPLASQPKPPAAQAPKTSGASSPEDKSQEDKAPWESFFPRSRIPKEQVQNLDTNRELW